MRLSAPKQGTWTVAIILGVLSILSHYGGVSIPIVSDADFLLLTLSFLLLLLGTVLKGF